jgi:hypothetical protein
VSVCLTLTLRLAFCNSSAPLVTTHSSSLETADIAHCFQKERESGLGGGCVGVCDVDITTSIL